MVYNFEYDEYFLVGLGVLGLVGIHVFMSRRLSKVRSIVEGGMPGKKKISIQEALDLLQNLPSESSYALTDDSSEEKVPASNLLEFSLDS
ncbi:hypothetical protein TNCV_1495261 [Trichonephila clavipes]|nr:hypothetical protein TNCV_1495261 [Trichonephila clavipes]